MSVDLAGIFSFHPAFFAGSIFVLGLVVGSFLNVVIYRLPIMLEREWRRQASDTLADEGSAEASALPAHHPIFNLSVPRSACPGCSAAITAWQNIPVVSWLALRGKCASCGTSISLRYPLVELGNAVLSAWVAWHFGFDAATVSGLLITWTLVALTGIDIDHQLLPDDLTLPLMWAGLVAAALFASPLQERIFPVDPSAAILGAAAGYLSLWSVFHLFKLVTGKEGMGFGDFKLLAALGAWLGWKMLPLIIILASVSGAAIGLLLITLRGRDRALPIPFGPYLAAGGWLTMMYGQPLISGYLRLSGLDH